MKVALFGAGGYTGLELCKLLAVHPTAELVCAASDSNAGRFVGEAITADHPLKFVTTAEARRMKCDVALLAVPPEPAKELAAGLLANGARVIDLSNAHRASDVYGLTSLFAKDIANAKLVANPGCYATCAITALAPWAEHVDGPIAIAAGSGVTGAGRTATEEMSLGEMYGEVRAYKVFKHQHVPEIEAALARLGKPASARVVLTTHLLPIARGIFMTITAKIAKPFDSDAYTRTFGSDPTLVVQRTPDEVSLRKVVGTSMCMVGAASDGDVIVITAALDNLLKGAASQAIENMNVMFGQPRMAGIAHLARHA